MWNSLYGRVTSWNGSRVFIRYERIYSFHQGFSVFYTINTLSERERVPGFFSIENLVINKLEPERERGRIICTVQSIEENVSPRFQQ